MATLVSTNAYALINAVDFSDHLKKLTLNYEAELHDDTVMGTSGTRSNKPGLKNWSFELELLQDYASGSIDATLFALVGAAAFAVELRAVNSAAAATNPSYEGNAVLESYPPLNAEIGQLASVTASFRGAGALTRDVGA